MDLDDFDTENLDMGDIMDGSDGNGLTITNLTLHKIEEGMTSGQLIEVMEKTWMNEKFAPEILPNQMEIVEALMDQIAHMEKNIEEHFKNQNDYKKGIHQMEVDRLRFLITSYLRFRLEKIELYVTEILQKERQRQERGEDLYLTDAELTFADEYSRSVRGHLETVKSFCPGLPPTELKNVAPNIHSMVFLKSENEVEGVLIDDGNDQDGDLIDLNKDSKVLISYNSVATLVKNGDVHLI